MEMAGLDEVLATGGSSEAVEIVDKAETGVAVVAGDSAVIAGELTTIGWVAVGAGGSERSGRGRCHISSGRRERLRSSRSAWSSLKWSISRRERRRFWQR